jgi:hypothetical protein
MKQNELERKVEEVKQDADVQRELKRTAPAEKGKGPVARGRDKFVIGSHLIFLIALGAIYQLLRTRFYSFAQTYPLAPKLVLSIAVIAGCLIFLRLINVYLVGRVQDTRHVPQRQRSLSHEDICAFFVAELLTRMSV